MFTIPGELEKQIPPFTAKKKLSEIVKYFNGKKKQMENIALSHTET